MNDPIRELKDIWHEVLEGPRELKRLGWNLLYPLVPLVVLVYLVVGALFK
jgi:hypothetical protein